MPSMACQKVVLSLYGAWLQSKCFLGKMFKEEKKSVMKQLFGTIASDDGEKRPNNACNLHIDAGVCGAVMH